MNLRELSKLASGEFSTVLLEQGFRDVGRSCLFARRAGEVLHVIAFDKSRHGERVRVHIYPWVPEFIAMQPNVESMSPERALSMTWGRIETLGPFTIGSTKWWPIASDVEAVGSLHAILPPLMQGALPWLDKFTSRAELLGVLLPDTPIEIRNALSSSESLAMPTRLERKLDSEQGGASLRRRSRPAR